MKRLLAGVFLEALATTLLFIPRAAAAGPTYVSGIITSDTTWTEAGSPYIVIGDTIVERDVTLTIEPRAVVRADGPYQLEVIGSIRAVGTEAQPILFTRHRDGQKWKGVSSRARGTAEFRYVTVEYAEVGITLVLQTLDWERTYLMDSLFQFNDLGFQARSATIQSLRTVGNVVRYNKQGAITSSAGNHIIENNEGHGLVTGTAVNSTIVNNGGDGVHLGSARNSLVAGNGGNGVVGGHEIMGSIIRDNHGHGLVVTARSASNVRNSSITGNGGFAIKMETDADLYAQENWWGTTDRDAIAGMIYDFSEDRLLGKVAFEPFLTASPSNAGPIPTATPSPAATPISTPLPAPTPTPIPCSWTGHWDTTAGGQRFAMSLSQSGGSVAGAYGTEPRQIQGTAVSSALSGRWAGPPSYQEPQNAGRFVFVIATDCNSFAGSWGFDQSATNGGVWSGARVTASAERVQLVTRLYQELLCREPDPEGLRTWAAASATEAQLRTAIGGSAEGQQAAAVRSLYLSTFGRDPVPWDCGGMRSWVDSGLGVGEMRAGLEGSVEGQRVRAVRDLYVELLGRDPLGPDDRGLRGWVDSPLTLEEIRQAILQSREYRSRR